MPQKCNCAIEERNGVIVLTSKRITWANFNPWVLDEWISQKPMLSHQGWKASGCGKRIFQGQDAENVQQTKKYMC